MSKDISVADDVKTAAVLSGSAGLLGAVTVPFLIPSIFEFVPPDQRSLPLPMPLFCVLVAIQFLVVYGLFGFAGLRMARARQREPAPRLTSIWTHERPQKTGFAVVLALATGLLCGLALVCAMALIRKLLPQTLPSMLHPSSLSGALLASATASFSEEILCRLFLVSAILRMLPVTGKSTVIAVVVSALVFGALHAPAAVFLFGGLQNVPLLSWLWMVSLNAFVGIACAVWYLRVGIGAAILVHFGTDLVWHVLSQVF